MMKPIDRIEELLVDEATEGLSVEAERELESLLEAHPDVDRYAFQRAAALAYLGAAAGVSGERMPQGLGDRILAAGEALLPGLD
jgi:hypothetical protein